MVKQAKSNNPKSQSANGGKQAGNTTSNELSKKLDRLMSRIPRGTFATVGGALAGPAGRAIGAGISSITGYGDYTVTHNSLVTGSRIGEMADQVPTFRTKGADTRIVHTEFIGNIVAGATPASFSSTTYAIDPTSTTTFPWLNKVANLYQRYKVRGMVFGYRSTSTDYLNNGTVAIAVNYDPAEPQWARMADMLNAKFAVSTKPSESMLAPVECDPARSPTDGYLIAHDNLGVDNTGTNQRFTTMGNCYVATEGLSVAAGTVIGQLWVTYDIELLYAFTNTVGFKPYKGGAAIGVASYATPAGLASDISTLIGTCGMDGLAAVGPTGNVSGLQNYVQILFDPSSASGAASWCRLVLQPGTWKVRLDVAGWNNGAVSVSTTLGTTFYGSKVTATGVSYAVSSGEFFQLGTYTVKSDDNPDARQVVFAVPQLVLNSGTTKVVTFNLSVISAY